MNKNNYNKQKGGFCMDSPCSKIETKIDPSIVINAVIKGILTPINFLTKSIFVAIKFIIEYWNDLIYRLSYVFQDFIFNLIFTTNGYIDIFNMIASELKIILSIALNLLTSNPLMLLSAYLSPFIWELKDFLSDSITVQMFSNLLHFNFKPLKDFFISFIYFLSGKTIKPTCKINHYATNSEKIKNCHAYDVPKCRLNLSTVFNTSYYILIVLYISGWLSFFKMFYSPSNNNNIIEFIRNKIEYYKKN